MPTKIDGFPNFVHQRQEHFINLLSSPILCAHEIIRALGYSFINICSLGKIAHVPLITNSKTLIQISTYHWKNVGCIMQNVYKYAFLLITPKAKISTKRRNGILSYEVKKWYFKNRHKFSPRISCSLEMLLLIVTRCAEFVFLGITTSLFAMLSYGHWENINNFSYRNTSITLIITDLYFFVNVMINANFTP